jgi:hypothetical protein
MDETIVKKQKKSPGTSVAEKTSFLGNISSTTVHLVVEALAFTVLYFHLSGKISELNRQVSELKCELEEQQETIDRHEEILRKLVGSRQPPQQQVSAQAPPVVIQQKAPAVVQHRAQPVVTPVQAPVIRHPHPVLEVGEVLEFSLPSAVPRPDSQPVLPSITELKEDALDAEIQDELREMESQKS